MKNLIAINDLSDSEINSIYNETKLFLAGNKNYSDKNKNIVLFFTEPSTRTLMSFQIAISNLRCKTINFNMGDSSIKKGESIKDTIRTIDSLNPGVVVIRDSLSGAAELFSRFISCPVINAGDGKNEHPTQALIDYFTIKERFNKIQGLNILICGDVDNSRVAHSDIKILGRFGANISLLAPCFMASKYKSLARYSEITGELLNNQDVIICLRIQKDRNVLFISDRDYSKRFCIRSEHLKYLKDNAIIMHAGPVNCGIEIERSVINDKKCLRDRQVKIGPAIRTEILNCLVRD